MINEQSYPVLHELRSIEKEQGEEAAKQFAEENKEELRLEIMRLLADINHIATEVIVPMANAAGEALACIAEQWNEMHKGIPPESAVKVPETSNETAEEIRERFERIPGGWKDHDAKGT